MLSFVGYAVNIIENCFSAWTELSVMLESEIQNGNLRVISMILRLQGFADREIDQMLQGKRFPK